MLFIRNLLCIYLIGVLIAYPLLKWRLNKIPKIKDNTPFGADIDAVSSAAALMSWFIVLIIAGRRLQILFLKLRGKFIKKSNRNK